MQDQNNEYFVNDLREGSELLRQAYQRFTQSVQLEGCQITSCYELRDTQAVIVDPRTGRWITGEMIRVVTQDSATYALPTDPIHMQLGIDADHLSMVKFTDPFDHRYSIIRERLSQCVAKAPGIVEARVPKVETPPRKHEGMWTANALTFEPRDGQEERGEDMHQVFPFLAFLSIATVPGTDTDEVV